MMTGLLGMFKALSSQRLTQASLVFVVFLHTTRHSKAGFVLKPRLDSLVPGPRLSYYFGAKRTHNRTAVPLPNGNLYIRYTSRGQKDVKDVTGLPGAGNKSWSLSYAYCTIQIFHVLSWQTPRIRRYTQKPSRRLYESQVFM